MSTRHASAALAFACILGTIIILFGHVRSLDHLTINHLYIALGLAVTLGAGHFMWEDNASWAKCLAFSLLWLVGTILCVGLSGGRSAAILEGNTLAATHENTTATSLTQDAKTERDASKLKSDAAEANAVDKEEAQAVACKSGTGPSCKGATLVAETARTRATSALAAYKKANLEYHNALAGKKAPTVSNAELRPFARVYGKLRSISEDEALDTVTTFIPYLFALLTEFGAIVFFHHASTPRPVDPTPEVKSSASDASLPSDPTLSSQPLASSTEPKITLSSICKDMGIDARTARKQLRILSIQRPAQGWAWTATDAEQIKSRLSTIN